MNFKAKLHLIALRDKLPEIFKEVESLTESVNNIICEIDEHIKEIFKLEFPRGIID